MAGTGKRMRAGMGETMEAAATRAANAHLFILFTPVLKGGTMRWMQWWRQRGEDGNRHGGA